jgi:hypothetical protein
MKLPSIENYLVYIFLAIIILAGLYFILNYSAASIYKAVFPIAPVPRHIASSKFSDTVPSSPDDVPGCPNVLIRKGNLLLLIDTHSPPQTGKNPIIFKNLDEYTYYVSSQRDSGKKSCPILFLQEESNAQGDDVYRVRPGPFDQQNNGTPGATMKTSEISGIQKFFNDKPTDKNTMFVDKSAPASFNKEAKIVNTDAVTTGVGSNNGKITRVENISTDNYATTPKPNYKPAELSSPDGFTKSSPFNSVTAVDSMATMQQNTLGYGGYNLPANKVSYSSTNMSSTGPYYNAGMTMPVNSGMTMPVVPPNLTQQIPQNTSVSSTSVVQGSVTQGPIRTTSVYPPLNVNQDQAIQTPFFNGSLGPYYGPGSNLTQSLNLNSQAINAAPMLNATRIPVPVVDASREDGPYNKNQYAGFDPYGQNIGTYTNIDQVHDSTSMQPLSDNPMDPNWGGVLYTRNQVISGKYDDNQVTKPVYGGSVNVSAIPSLLPNGGPPIYIDKKQIPNNCNDQVKMSTRTLRGAPENA